MVMGNDIDMFDIHEFLCRALVGEVLKKNCVCRLSSRMVGH